VVGSLLAILRLCKIMLLVLTPVVMLLHASAALPSILSAVTEAMAYGRSTGLPP